MLLPGPPPPLPFRVPKAIAGARRLSLALVACLTACSGGGAPSATAPTNPGAPVTSTSPSPTATPSTQNALVYVSNTAQGAYTSSGVIEAFPLAMGGNIAP